MSFERLNIMARISAPVDFNSHLVHALKIMSRAVVKNLVFGTFAIHFQHVATLEIIFFKDIGQGKARNVYSVATAIFSPAHTRSSSVTGICLNAQRYLSPVSVNGFSETLDLYAPVQPAVSLKLVEISRNRFKGNYPGVFEPRSCKKGKKADACSDIYYCGLLSDLQCESGRVTFLHEYFFEFVKKPSRNFQDNPFSEPERDRIFMVQSKLDSKMKPPIGNIPEQSYISHNLLRFFVKMIISEIQTRECLNWFAP